MADGPEMCSDISMLRMSLSLIPSSGSYIAVFVGGLMWWVGRASNLAAVAAVHVRLARRSLNSSSAMGIPYLCFLDGPSTVMSIRC